MSVAAPEPDAPTTGADTAPEPVVTRLGEGFEAALAALLGTRGLRLHRVAAGQPIPGSFWGETEAGLIGDTLYVRPDTPVHSALHEASHWICMDPERRTTLHTDANSGEAEEHAVCYLQCILADEVPGYSRAQIFIDMDAWGYNFVLGSTQAWFERDAEDARAWLREHGLIP